MAETRHVLSEMSPQHFEDDRIVTCSTLSKNSIVNETDTTMTNVHVLQHVVQDLRIEVTIWLLRT